MNKVLHIDESGNLGKDGRFFVISAVEYLDRKRIQNFIRKNKKDNSLTEIKGSTLSVPERQKIINHLNYRADYFISYIILDKKNLDNKKLFQDNNILFNYLCSFLFKGHLKNSSDDFMLCFDNRTVKVKSGNSLKDYLRILAYTKLNCSSNLDLCYLDSKSDNCIQMTDVIANTIYQSYTNKTAHFYDQLKISHSIRFPQAKFGR